MCLEGYSWTQSYLGVCQPWGTSDFSPKYTRDQTLENPPRAKSKWILACSSSSTPHAYHLAPLGQTLAPWYWLLYWNGVSPQVMYCCCSWEGTSLQILLIRPWIYSSSNEPRNLTQVHGWKGEMRKPFEHAYDVNYLKYILTDNLIMTTDTSLLLT